MASYSMYSTNPNTYGAGGGLYGVGDIGQAIYTGYTNAIPTLQNIYNFEDQNKLRQDAMNAEAARLRDIQYGSGANAMRSANSINGLLQAQFLPAGSNAATQLPQGAIAQAAGLSPAIAPAQVPMMNPAQIIIDQANSANHNPLLNFNYAYQQAGVTPITPSRFGGNMYGK